MGSLREALQAPRALIAVSWMNPNLASAGGPSYGEWLRSLPALQPHYYQQVYRRISERFAELNLQLILDVDGTALKPVQELKLLSQSARP